MYDASKVQKINSIARELINKGQATSMDQAIKIATQQVDSGQFAMPAAPSPVETLPEVPEKSEVSVEISDGEGSVAGDALRALQRMLSEQQTAVSRMTNAVNAHSNQFNDINNKINSLIAGMTALQQEIQKLKSSPVAPPMKPKDAQSGQTQFKQDAPSAAPAPAQKPQSGSGHARTGNYNPDDVSIEKFFYYGNR